jgi:hypothetical protein
MASEKEITFRCAGRRERDAMHTISVVGGRVTCSCNGVDWCSHIDATLVSRERYMVPAEDRLNADRARRAVGKRLRAPDGWLATWREDRVWRGLAPPRTGERERMHWDALPTLCFIGSGKSANRGEYTDHALSLGWRLVDKPLPLTTLVVESAGTKTNARSITAKAFALPVITPSQWEEWCYDLTNAVMERIEFHGFEPGKTQRNAA